MRKPAHPKWFYVYERDCAMHGAWELKTPWGYIVFQPPVLSFGVRQRWFLYLSPDATPAQARFRMGARH